MIVHIEGSLFSWRAQVKLYVLNTLITITPLYAIQTIILQKTLLQRGQTKWKFFKMLAWLQKKFIKIFFPLSQELTKI